MTQQPAAYREAQELITELEKLQKAKEVLEFKLKTAGISTTCAPAPCHFLKKMPIEVRNLVYSLLLTNPDLGEMNTIECNEIWGQWALEDYGLSPAILRVNRQIYLEASKILYETNTFAVFCHEADMLTAINRYDVSDSVDDPVDDHTRVFPRVRRWKLMITAKPNASVPEQPVSLDPIWKFCDLIYGSPSTSIQLHLTSEIPDPEHICGALHRGSWTRVLEILETLRNVSCLSLNTSYVPSYKATIHPSDYMYFRNGMKNVIGSTISMQSMQNAKILIEGNMPVERLSLMYRALDNYAKTFERCEIYRGYMSFPSSFSGPFTTEPCHPVEEALGLARLAFEKGDSFDFKGFRRQILSYLEPQYRRIVEASIVVQNFIKEWAPRGYLRTHKTEGELDQLFGMAMVLVEDYAATFRRDMPIEVKQRIRLMQRQFDLAYSNLPREKLFAELNHLFEHRDAPYVQGRSFKTWFPVLRKLLDDLDGQLLQIRKARAALFKGDSTDNLWSEAHVFTGDLQIWGDANGSGMVRKTVQPHVHMGKICPPPEWKYSSRPGWGKSYGPHAVDVDPWSSNELYELGTTMTGGTSNEYQQDTWDVDAVKTGDACLHCYLGGGDAISDAPLLKGDEEGHKDEASSQEANDLDPTEEKNNEKSSKTSDTTEETVTFTPWTWEPPAETTELTWGW